MLVHVINCVEDCADRLLYRIVSDMVEVAVALVCVRSESTLAQLLYDNSTGTDTAGMALLSLSMETSAPKVLVDGRTHLGMPTVKIETAPCPWRRFLHHGSHYYFQPGF